MMIDRPLRIAFLFSLGLHSILFSPLLSFVNHPIKIRDTKIEVTYIKIKEEKYLDTKPISVEDVKVSLKKGELAPPKKEKAAKNAKPERSKEIKKDEILLSKKAINLNTFTLQEGRSDSLNYLRSIRNKINRYVHRNYDSLMGEGEALMHFMLSSDGSVKSASIIKDNMGDNERLRKLCLDSVQLSSPFKSFPEGLDLPCASFNISISFKER